MAVTPRAPSQTAVLTAVARAMHREEPPPWVVDDYLALDLAGEAGPIIRERLRREVPADDLLAFSRWVCVRARVPEDMIELASAAGVEQYVILGAGLDSFAYRRGDLLPRLRVFEVDHPASQAWKGARLHDLGIRAPANLVFAPIDFEHQTLREGLDSAGFDFGSPAVFSWIGVTMYLTRDAIEATLETIAESEPGSQVVLTYNLPRQALGGPALGIQNRLEGIASDMGEPFVSLFDPAEIEDMVRRSGFDDIAHLGPAEALETYFPGRADVRLHGAQRLLIARVGTRTGS